jgi:hypothetical protein
MTGRGSDEYHPQLFLDEVFNDESSSSIGGIMFFANLRP